jgi:hypothetical protein
MINIEKYLKLILNENALKLHFKQKKQKRGKIK